MNKKLLLLPLMLVMLVASVNAALLFDSNTEWVVDSSNVSGFTESANAEWNISQTQAVILDTSLRTSIERIEEIKSLSITVVNVTDNGEGFLQYYPDSGQFITTYFNTSNAITVSNNGTDVEIPYNYVDTIKLVMNVSVNQYQVLINDLDQGTFNYDSGAVVPFTLKIDNGALTTGMNISYLCTDDDDESCGGGIETFTAEEPTVFETAQTYYYFNISFENMTNGTVAAFSHNGSIFEQQQPTFLNSSHAEFQVNYSTPLVEVNNSALNFQWSYSINLTNGSLDNYTIPENTQLVYWEPYPINLTAPDGVVAQSVTFSFAVPNSSGEIATNTNIIEYNGSNYSATQSGTTYSSAITLPTEITGLAEILTANFYTNVTFNGTSFLRSQSATQSVSTAALYDCSTSSAITNATTLNITFFDEVTLIETPATLDVSFQFTPEGSSVLYNTSFSFAGSSNYAICLYPEDGSFYLDNGYFEYGATDYDDRIYYLLDTNLTNQSLDLSLYLINSSLPSDVSMFVLDNLGNGVSGAYIDVQRYYPGNATYEVVETVLTDVNGLAVASIILNDVTYKFNVDFDGNTIYTSSGAPVYSTTLYFYVSLTTVTDSVTLEENDISYYVSYSNTTDLFSFFFNDGDGAVTQGCMRVYQSTTAGENLINETCTNSSSATITYLLNQSTGTFVARGYVETPTSGEVYLNEAWALIGGLYKTVGNYGTLLSIIVTGTLAFAGMFMAEAVLIMALVGLIASYFMGLTFLTQQMLMVLLLMAGLILFKKAR